MNKWLYRILLILFSAIFLISAGFLAQYFIASRKQANQYDDLSDLVEEIQKEPLFPVIDDTPDTDETDDPDEEDNQPATHVTVTHPETGETFEILREYAPVFEMNPDLVGWIRIDDTRLNYPVMQTPDRPNFYLTHDFYEESSRHGCVYAQENCDVFAPSDNTVIYGHRMKDGSMFATILKYSSLDFLKEHPTITFDTLTEHHTYQIISFFLTTASVGQGFPYHTFVDAASEAEFNQFIAKCKSLSLHDIGVDAEYGDKLITLSTCEYSQVNGRLVVVAKRIS